MLITFRFLDNKDFKEAQEALKRTIDFIGSKRFDHSVQPVEKTISVPREYDAHLIEEFFKENGIGHYKKEVDTKWIGHKACISDFLRKASLILET